MEQDPVQVGQPENNCPPGSSVEVSVPASLEYLPVLSTSVREYCATLPALFQTLHDPEKAGQRPPGVGTLTLPNSNATILTSYSHFVYSVELIVQELASNIIRHGYATASGRAELQLTLCVETGAEGWPALAIYLEDSAPAFNPTEQPFNPPQPQELRESGYGLYLVDRLSDQLIYTRIGDKNRLKVLKYLY